MKQGMVWNEVLIEGSEAILCLMCLIKSIEELQNGRIREILELERCVTVFRPKGGVGVEPFYPCEFFIFSEKVTFRRILVVGDEKLDYCDSKIGKRVVG